MRNGDERNSPPYSEVALGLKMQQSTPSYAGSEGGGGSGSGPFFNSSGNQQHVYELANGVLVQTTSLDSRPSGGSNMMMALSGKALFTISQLQELERQKLIHKYILASIPVPPQLLLNASTTSPSPPSSLTQCNTSSSLDLRFSSNGSDPEPWRCKRTDGKKWRCSRDVAPDQKYCERHAHKNRPRSRKHVENSPHNYSHKPFVLPSNNPTTTLRRSLPSAAPYDQTRCMEWLMRGGNSDGTSGTAERDVQSVYRPHFADKQGGFMGDAILSSKTINSDQTTRLFIDAWGKEGIDGSKRAEKKLWPSSSLSLSMGDGMMMKSEWEWTNSSPPGGPLGEALCLGNANTRGGGGGGSNLASPHGYSNSSKSSCDDGSHALNFIG